MSCTLQSKPFYADPRERVKTISLTMSNCFRLIRAILGDFSDSIRSVNS